MKRLLLALSAILACAPAFAQQKPTDQIKSDITTLLPSTGNGSITASQLRQVTNEIADSYANKGGDTFTGPVTIPFTQTGTGGAASTIDAKLKRVVDLDDYRISSDTSDCAAFQRAQDANAGAVVRLPPRQIELGTSLIACQVSITHQITFEGTGWQETQLSGTVLHIPNTTSSPFAISGTSVRGVTFRNLGIKQDHPATGPSTWAPTVYPFVFDVQNTLGEVRLENIFASPVYRLVNVYNSGRINLRGIRGQIFKNVVTMDNILDVARLADFHIWTYWTSDQYVQQWTQANLDVVAMGRADTPILDKIFAFGCHALLHTYDTSAGSPSKIEAGILVADACKYGWWNEASAATGDFGSLNYQGEAVPTGPGTPVAGARAIYDTGANSRYRIAMMHTERNDANAIEVTGAGATINIGAAYFRYFNQANNGSGAVKISGSGSVVLFGNAPLVTDSNGGAISNAGTLTQAPVQGNVPAAQANYPVIAGGATGSGVNYGVAGSDATVDLYLQPKGAAGSVRLKGASGTDVLRVDDFSAGNSNLLLRPGTGFVSVTVESGSANADLNFGPKGTGTLKVNGTSGVSCSGAPTASFAVTNGLVTHC